MTRSSQYIILYWLNQTIFYLYQLSQPQAILCCRIPSVATIKDDIQSNLRMREKHCFQNKPYHYNYMKYDILHE